MDLATIQAGMVRAPTRLSECGNARLRRTIWMLGRIAGFNRTDSFRDQSERYCAQDTFGQIAEMRIRIALAKRVLARGTTGIVRVGLSLRQEGRSCILRADAFARG
jgi:hypothetical protein